MSMMPCRSLMLVVSMVVAATSAAQAPAPDAAAAAPAAVSGRVVSGNDGPPSAQDPRVCLEFPNRAQVVACAEKYRSRRGAAKS
jgi:hypothetical protein